MPDLIIIAGPNGAGKTTLTQYLSAKKYIPKNIPVINPDELLKLSEVSSDVQAGKLALKQRNESLGLGKSFAFETTFSGNSEIYTIQKAIQKGYNIKLYFITLQTPQDWIDRVKNRVVEGGHNVSDENIIRRYKRSHKNLLNIAKIIHQLIVFDNSSFKRKMIFAASKGKILNKSKTFQSQFIDNLRAVF